MYALYSRSKCSVVSSRVCCYGTRIIAIALQRAPGLTRELELDSTSDSQAGGTSRTGGHAVPEKVLAETPSSLGAKDPDTSRPFTTGNDSILQGRDLVRQIGTRV